MDIESGDMWPVTYGYLKLECMACKIWLFKFWAKI